ncbi:MAG: hypothetical protein IT290_04300 [Deltaproteobacteria bacterium]|nr:hypothetical protein [Deltaproteobacteria bacterium]
MTEPQRYVSTVSWRERATEILVSLLGSLIMLFEVPWSSLLSTGIPSGGDNPAHPVLMLNARDALLQHATIIHYSYDFWAGFELFQFYFPLSYLAGGLLSTVIHPYIAFKLITVVGSVLLPLSFHFMVRGMGLSRVSGVIAQLCAISFLYTDAHRMWGGNVFSALAGMIGNSWTFIFVPLAIGELFRARAQLRFSATFAFLAAAAALSHFYGFLLLLLFGVVFAAVDLVEILRGRLDIRRLIPFYASAIAGAGLIAWWLIPLVFYKPFSSDFGGNWGVSLWTTTEWAERVYFVVAGVLCLAFSLIPKCRSRAVIVPTMFAVLSLLFFFSNRVFSSTAFIDVRLWHQVYFAMFVLIVVAYAKLETLLPPVAFVASLIPLWFLVPPDQAFLEARTWARWNFDGIEVRAGGPEFLDLVAELSKLPPSRVSFESSDMNNGIFGSVRAFELLPALTPHEIVEGGIVNSATYSGIGYFLQCLTSATCAGWPPGMVPPGKDIPRAIEMMEALGVNYHIATTHEIAVEFEKSGKVDKLYQGQFITLFRLRKPATNVEVYDGPLPILSFDDPLTTLVNLPRYDRTRNAGYVFDTSLVPAVNAAGERIDPRRLSGFLLREWYHGARVADRGWETRREDRHSYANGLLLSWDGNVDLQSTTAFELFVADRGFDPDVVRSNQQHTHHQLALPLLGLSPGTTRLKIHSDGYSVALDGETLPAQGEAEVTFTGENQLRVIRFTTNGEQRYRYLDIQRFDRAAEVALPGEAEIVFPARITDRCEASLNAEFHLMTLRTNCPGKPHLLKYSYYPKWKSDVPISMGTNNFMTLTPTSEVTVLKHEKGRVDVASLVLSLGALATLAGVAAARRRRAADVP